MSSETDHPRQRTVAELLAEHGDAGATGRRRRRREADGPEEGAAPPRPVNGNATAAPEWRPAPPPEPDRSVLRERVPSEPPSRDSGRPAQPQPASWDAPPQREAPPQDLPRRDGPPRETAFRDAVPPPRRDGPPRETAFRDAVPPPRRYAPEPDAARPAPPAGPARSGPAPVNPAPPPRAPEREQNSGAVPMGPRPAPDPRRDRPTDVMPRIREPHPITPDPGLTGPIQQQRPTTDRPNVAAEPDRDEHDAGGVDLQKIDAPEVGPPTMVGAAPAGAEAWHRNRTAARSAAPADVGPPTQAAPVDFADHPAGLGGPDPDDDPEGDVDGADPDDHGADGPASRRLDRLGGDSTGQAWAAVLAQWIIGAIGGAALWVGFRFLWRELPVVALAAAALVTVGLVVVVRALLRNDDARTTVFAVLVGLLLTVSPAILVLLGR